MTGLRGWGGGVIGRLGGEGGKSIMGTSKRRRQCGEVRGRGLSMVSSFRIRFRLERNVEDSVNGIFIYSNVSFGACCYSSICTLVDRTCRVP